MQQNKEIKPIPEMELMEQDKSKLEVLLEDLQKNKAEIAKVVASDSLYKIEQHIMGMEYEAVESLVGKENEQTRGYIYAIRDVRMLIECIKDMVKQQ